MESKKINQLATNVAPQTSDLTIIGDPVTGVSKKITLLQIADLFATTGTVTSVAVTETGDALTISGSPITTAGTINIGFAGGANQYVRGDGALADFPTSTGGGSSVSYYLNSSVSQGTIGGVAYRELSKDPISGAGTDITISSNGYVASYITDANDPSLLEVPGGNFNCEFYFSVNSNAHNPYVYAELYKYDGTTFTLLGSSQSVAEYLTNGTTLSPYYFAIPVATAALTITDRLAIRIYVNVDTRVVTLHTENNHLCQVVTTFSKGLTSLNNLTRQVQFLATGTSGTDFNISSSTATHTFNLPVASATNTGKLSSTDWSTFNGKQAALSFTAPLINTSNTISIPVATASVDGYLDNADWTIFNNKQNAITLTTTGTSGAATLVGSTLNIPNYAPDLSGYVTLTTTQTITGTKVLQNGAVLPSTGGTNQISVFINTFNIEEASGTTNRFGFNDSNNIYFNKGVLGGGGINGGLISFNNTASRTYTLQNASGTLAFTSDLSAYLPLAGGTLSGALNINLGSGTGLNVASDLVIFRASTGFATPRQITLAAGNGATTYLEAKGYGGNYITDFGIRTYNSSGTAFEVFFATSAGDVGIGNTAPAAKLDVNGTGRFTSNLIANNNISVIRSGSSVTTLGQSRYLNLNDYFGNTNARMEIGLGYSAASGITNVPAIIGYLQTSTTDFTKGDIYFATRDVTSDTAPTERMRITSGGNVGIGTSSPSWMLEVNKDTSSGSFGQYPAISINNPNASGYSAYYFFSGATNKGGIEYSNSTNDMLIYSNGTERMRITSGGNVGIGTTAASAGRLVVTSANNTSGIYAAIFADSSGADLLLVRGDGAIFTGTRTNSPYNLSTTGRSAVIESSGALGYLVSTRESKANIESIKSIDFINKLNPVQFNYRKKDNINNVFTDEIYENITYGFIADEVEKVNKELVFYKEDGTLAGVEYNNMIAILTKAVQELEARIKQLENK